MKFRPCIDIHNGKVKQIVGGSLKDEGDKAEENFVSEKDAGYYAGLYRKDGLAGGHIILLNARTSGYYEATLGQAERALRAWPKGMQLGGGVCAENAASFLDMGASHVIVTSYAFSGGKIQWEHLERLKAEVGKEQVVLDLSCRKKDGAYFAVTDRWQKFTEEKISQGLFKKLEGYCSEYLVHGVDVEGRACGVDEELAEILGDYQGLPVTYAGGIGSIRDVKRFAALTKGRVDFTVGSALDLFGGGLPYEEVIRASWQMDGGNGRDGVIGASSTAQRGEGNGKSELL